MELHLNIIGGILIALAAVHAAFPKYFNWQKEFAQISLINRQMMYVHTFFIALILLLMGVICLLSSNQLINTSLGRQVCLGMGIFWMARLLIQLFGYSPKLWKGKKFETAIHILFIFLWGYFSVVFIVAYYN
jgi:hypothetical protein